jgi:aminoglycoside phosphotransferase (APT) family kinase protein
MKGGMLTSDVYNRLSSRKLSQIYTQMGAALALLHEAATSRPVAQFASQNFKPIHRHLEPLLHQESCHLTEKERQTVIEIYDRQQQTQPEQHLCHGDAHSGNFLFDAYGRVTALLDFGQAGYGSPAIDFFHAMEHGPFSITGNSYKKNGKQPPIQQSVREQRILCLAYCILNHEKHVYRQGLEGEMPIELKTTALHPLKAEIRAYNKPSPRQSAHGLG